MHGTQKAIGELLVADYTRKDSSTAGRCGSPRSPCARKPNAAASSFASGIIREPVNGEESICPVDRSTRMWVISPESAVGGFIHAHDLPADRLGANRSISLPGLSVTVGEMAAALERVAGPAAAARIRWERDPRITKLVDTWPGTLDASRARELGFPHDHNFDAIVRAYVESRAAFRLKGGSHTKSASGRRRSMSVLGWRSAAVMILLASMQAGAQPPKVVAFANVSVVPMTGNQVVPTRRS